MRLTQDTSCIVAYLTKELNWHEISVYLGSAEQLIVGEATLLEANLVLYGRSLPGDEMLGILLREASIRREAFQQIHFELATTALVKYGKGRHPARLNFGDCMSYATAKVADAPLLYCGDDFGKTDLNCIRV